MIWEHRAVGNLRTEQRQLDRAIANGVPLPMGRAVARAVKAALQANVRAA